MYRKGYDRFVHEFVTEISLPKIGDPTKRGTAYISVLSRKSQIDFLEGQVKMLLKEGSPASHRRTSDGFAFEALY